METNQNVWTILTNTTGLHAVAIDGRKEASSGSILFLPHPSTRPPPASTFRVPYKTYFKDLASKSFKSEVFKEAGRRDHRVPCHTFLLEHLGRLCTLSAPLGGSGPATRSSGQSNGYGHRAKKIPEVQVEKYYNAQFLTPTEPPLHTNCLEHPGTRFCFPFHVSVDLGPRNGSVAVRRKRKMGGGRRAHHLTPMQISWQHPPLPELGYRAGLFLLAEHLPSPQ